MRAMVGVHQVSDHTRLVIFLSHANSDGPLVERTARALSELTLQPFVAAHHVAPAEEWLPQLEAELLRADVLAAFLSPAFRDSAWTDQEIGHALGRRRMVIPIQLDKSMAPHGFLHRYQSLPAFNMTPDQIAASIFQLLLGYPETRTPLRNIVFRRLKSDRSEVRLQAWVARAVTFDRLTGSEHTELSAALESNPVIRNNSLFASSLRDIINRGFSSEGAE
jgi:hypothetical protein